MAEAENEPRERDLSMGRQGKPHWLVSLLFGPNFGKPNVERMKAERDIPGLIDTLSNREYGLSWPAATALIELGAPAVEALIGRIAMADETLRSEIARVLGQIADPRGVEPLIRLAKDESVRVRQWAVYALTRSESPRVTEALCEALADDDSGVQHTASSALQTRIDARIAATLIRVAQNPKASVEVQDLLRYVLDRSADTVSTEDLRRAAQLNDSYVLIFVQAETSCTFTTFNTTAEECDFTQIKQMARQELIRRGLEAR